MPKDKAEYDKADAWAALEGQARLSCARPMRERFAAEAQRAARWCIEAAGWRIDVSRTHLDADFLAAGLGLWRVQHGPAWLEDMAAGGRVNITEQRAALHGALRSPTPPEMTDDDLPVRALLATADARLQALVTQVRADESINAILHLGIGGSALGPELVTRALEDPAKARFTVRFAANVDPLSLDRALLGLDPARTLIVYASKSWTTAESQANLLRALDWASAGGTRDPKTHLVAATSRVDLAADFGLAEARILPVGTWVGGRFSLWSAMGAPAALQLGWEAFQDLRAGAAAMDAICGEDDPMDNPALLLALVTLLYGSGAGRDSRAVFAYEERLRLLVPYLQQLEMESCGKGVDENGQPLGDRSGPLVWGGVGADAQHAVFQQLHQGSHWSPIDFVAVRTKPESDARAQRDLLANMLAQSAALLCGRQTESPHRCFPGDRPSVTLMAEALTPYSLGALLALYEARTAILGRLYGLNPFDQMGVELGKEIAGSVSAALEGVGGDFDPATQAWINWVRRSSQNAG